MTVVHLAPWVKRGAYRDGATLDGHTERMKPNWFIGLPVGDVGVTGSWPAPPARVRLFAAADVHLTVAFLGPCGAEAAQAAWDALPSALPPPVRGRLGALEPFGRTALATPLTEGRPAAVALIEALRGPLLAAAGARPDNRPPNPHVTWARAYPKGRAQRAAVDAWRAAIGEVDVDVRFDAIALYTWAEPPGAARFRVVRRRALAAPISR